MHSWAADWRPGSLCTASAAGTLPALLEPAALLNGTPMSRSAAAADSSLELTVDAKTFDGSMLSRAAGVSKPGRGNVGQVIQQGL